MVHTQLDSTQLTKTKMRYLQSVTGQNSWYEGPDGEDRTKIMICQSMCEIMKTCSFTYNSQSKMNQPPVLLLAIVISKPIKRKSDQWFNSHKINGDKNKKGKNLRTVLPRDKHDHKPYRSHLQYMHEIRVTKQLRPDISNRIKQRKTNPPDTLLKNDPNIDCCISRRKQKQKTETWEWRVYKYVYSSRLNTVRERTRFVTMWVDFA